MKSIIVPVDFSECSANAFKYALEIANEAKCDIVLLHLFHVPIPPPDAIVDPLSEKALKEEYNNKLRKMADDVFKKMRTGRMLNIIYESLPGFVSDEVIKTAQKHRADLIVMGTHGATGLKKFFYGSNTVNIIKKSKVAVLAVPSNIKFDGIQKIAFAVDLNNLQNESALKPLVNLALMFNSEIKLFFVQDNIGKHPDLKNEVEHLMQSKMFKLIPHTFHISQGKDIVNAIETFVKDSSANLLVTMHHKHSFWEILNNKSTTETLSFHAKIPLLSIQE